jgi:hypothetical protein
MPGKSRHGKGKHHQHSKKNRAKQRYSATVPQPHMVTGNPAPATTMSMPPAAKAPVSPTPSGAPKYPYITSEIKRIGILAAIILVILILLARILS